MSLVTSLSGTLSVTDNLTGSVALAKVLNFAFTGTTFGYDQTLSVGTSPVAVALPVSPVQVVLVQNTSTTASVQVAWTPTGGSPQSTITLDPGAVILLIENTTSNGITALSLTASAVSTPVSIVLAG